MSALATDIRPNEYLPAKRLTAYMATPDGGWPEGSVHDDKYAIEVLGLRGGLVGGVTLFAYLEEMLGSFFGPTWLTGSTMDVKFIAGGAVNGDELTLRGRVLSVDVIDSERRRAELEVAIDNQTTGGNSVVVGTASVVL